MLSRRLIDRVAMVVRIEAMQGLKAWAPAYQDQSLHNVQILVTQTNHDSPLQHCPLRGPTCYLAAKGLYLTLSIVEWPVINLKNDCIYFGHGFSFSASANTTSQALRLFDPTDTRNLMKLLWTKAFTLQQGGEVWAYDYGLSISESAILLK